MDPPPPRDPIILLVELIDLLREIKDASIINKATAAVTAIQHVAARSKELQEPEASPVTSPFPATAPPEARIVPSVGVSSLTSPALDSSHVQLPSTPVAVPVAPADTRTAPSASDVDIHGLSPVFPRAADVPAPSGGTSMTNVLGPATEQAGPFDTPAVIASGPDISVPAPPTAEPKTQAAGRTNTGPKAPVAGVRKGRNLIVCIDGTSNQFSKKNTNVVELYSRLIKDEEQLTFYNSGIGTYATPSWRSWKYIKQIISNKIDLAIAWKFEKILLSAYLWLVENYREGDRIFLFGFSRGAYQVRALSAMINNVGLLYKGNQDQIAFAYELYAETKHIEDVDFMRARFKETFSQDVAIELVAVWDTVSSVGLVRDKTLPGTTDGMKHVKYFRHALALHERRVKFLPENARAGSGPSEEDTRAESGSHPHTKEVWFAGSHSDIGGGATTNDDLNRFGPALRWISFEAILSGVRLKDTPYYWEDGEINNSLTPAWKIFEVFPIARLTYRGETNLTHRPHFGRPRKIRPNQLVHETALTESQDRNINSWRARLPEGMDWNKLTEHNLVEKDPYTAVESVLQKMRDSTSSAMSEADITALRTVLSTGFGVGSMRDEADAPNVLMAALTRSIAQDDDINFADARPTMEVLFFAIEKCRFHYADFPLSDAAAYATKLAPVDQQLASLFMQIASPPVIGPALQHPSFVLRVACMSDGGRIVTGCGDGAVRTWDVDSGAIMGVPMTGHAGSVFDVSVSADGSRIASGSVDNTVRVWTAGTGEMVAVLEGHSDSVFSVAFSPDGLRVVSGSADKTIRVWDVASSKTVVGPTQEHSKSVYSVAYSPEGSRIVSGSWDETVCVWNAETGLNVWRAQVASQVFSVVFSPNGKQIIAGCFDGSVHVLDAETGEIVLGPLKGHTHWVKSVALSPDGKRIASGSHDRTVRLWNAETGEEIDVFRGHSDGVSSVAFSPDGKRVASASADETVRIWDAMRESKIFPHILRFFGLDLARWEAGFASRTDLFEWVRAGRFFHPACLRESYRRAHTRLDRAMYQNFLRFVRELESSGQYAEMVPQTRQDVVELAKREFGKKEEYDALVRSNRRRAHLKAVFNGHLVMEWTGLFGLPVREVMDAFRARVSDDELMEMNVEQVEVLVKEIHLSSSSKCVV